MSEMKKQRHGKAKVTSTYNLYYAGEVVDQRVKEGGRSYDKWIKPKGDCDWDV